jgi:hypothetical protein
MQISAANPDGLSYRIQMIEMNAIQLLTWRSVTVWFVSLWELHMGIATLNGGYGKSL